MNRRGFTLMEILVVMLIVSLILQCLLILLVQGMRNSTKGNDYLNAVRGIHNLFFAMRKSLLGCTGMVLGPASPQDLENASAAAFLPPPGPEGSWMSDGFLRQTASHSITFFRRDMIVRDGKLQPRLLWTDSFSIMPGGTSDLNEFFIEEITQDRISGKTVKREHLVPRMRQFNCVPLKLPQSFAGNAFESKHLYVEISLKSDDPRQSNREICLRSFLTPSNISFSDWWDGGTPRSGSQ